MTRFEALDQFETFFVAARKYLANPETRKAGQRIIAITLPFYLAMTQSLPKPRLP